MGKERPIPTFDSKIVEEVGTPYLALLNEVKADFVNHPPHYTADPSGVECIEITRHRNFNVGNAIKYLWRNGLKEAGSLEKQIQDLEKAIFYIEDEIARLEAS